MRKIIRVVVPMEGRDKGKTFELTEMPAVQAEKWGMRALLAVGAGGVDLPTPDPTVGIYGIFMLGFRAVFTIPFAQAEPLLDEMMTCASFVSDPQKGIVRPIDLMNDIEEPGTLLWLREAIFELHTGFSIADALSGLTSAISEWNSSNMSTTQQPLEPASPLN